MIAGPIRCPVLVGRERELRSLIDLRLAAARGRGACALVSGGAGIGKSRLLAAFRETLTGGRAAFGLGLTREFGDAPYGPALSALEGIGCRIRLAPELTLGEQLAALVQGVVTAAQRRHVVLAIEDVQWADEGTLRFLLYLLPSLAHMRACLVVTYRSDELNEGHPAVPYLARFARTAAVHRIELEALPPAELRHALRLAAGQRQLPATVLRDIVDRSDGNPLFAEELLKSALEHRLAAPSKHDLPFTIRAAVQERCSVLHDAERSVLFHAAVLGKRFEPQLLARICDRPISDVLPVLRRLCRLQLIDEPEAPSSTYAFRHTLTRDAVYGTMLADEIIPLHRSILSVLEECGAGAHDLGYHALAARDARKTVRYNERAGDDAIAVHADADALRCYERALPGASGAAERARLLEKGAGAAARAGRADRAATLYEEAALAAEALGDEERVVRHYVAMSGQARLGGDTLRSREILHRAIARLKSQSSQAKGRLAIALAFTHVDRADLAGADAAIAQATSAKESLEYASAIGYAAAVRGDLDAVRAAAALCLQRSESLGTDAVLRARFNLGFSLCALGCDEEALHILESLLGQLREQRLTALEVAACANAGLMHARGARWDSARALIERGLGIPESTTTGPIALAAAGLTVAIGTGDDELARQSAPPDIVDAAFESRINSTIGRIAGPYARWLHARGDATAAAAALRTAIGALAGPFGASETLIAAAELADGATRDSASTFIPALEAMSLPIYSAAAAHVRALLASGADAARHAAEAAAHYRALRWPVHEREALRLTGERRTGNDAGEPRRPESSKLSARELEVAALVVKGVPNKSLAKQLAVSQRTVEKHLTSIFGKLGLRNRTELVAVLLRRPPP